DGAVLPGERAEIVEDLLLGDARRQVERPDEPQRRRDLLEEVVERGDADRAEHLPDVVVGVWREPHGVGVYGRTGSAGRVLEAVLRDERQVVPLVEDLAADLRVAFPQPADLSVLLRDQFL